jgi:hypothetical protein
MATGIANDPLVVFAHQPIQNQTVKSIAAGAPVTPSQVGTATPTERDLPAVAGKPGPFGGGYPDLSAARCGGKAADVKHQSMGISKRMLMPSLDSDALLGIRYGAIAVGTV